MKKPNKLTAYLDKATYFIEVMVSSLLLVAIVILLLEMICEQIGVPFKVLTDDFESILSKAFTLVIGVEFIKMLCKHSAETVIEVLLFAIARQMILSHGDALNMLLGVAAIAGLFAAKRFFILRDSRQKEALE